MNDVAILAPKRFDPNRTTRRVFRGIDLVLICGGVYFFITNNPDLLFLVWASVALIAFGLLRFIGEFVPAKGLVLNEDGITERKDFVPWSDLALYFFHDQTEGGAKGNFLVLRPKEGKKDIYINLDKYYVEGAMADHILPFGEANGVPRGHVTRR